MTTNTEKTAETKHTVLPAANADQLSAEQLEKVAGGQPEDYRGWRY
jgi:hypothetical protein